VYFGTFAVLIAIGFWRKKHFLERVFDLTFAMTREGWDKLSRRWLVLFILAASANEFVRITMTPEFWIDYKFTKVIIIATFACYQFTLSRKYRIPGESNAWGLRIKDPAPVEKSIITQ
jgi:intracellular septation protein A